MTDVLGMAKVVVEPAVRLLLADRKQRSERSLPLAELVNVTLADDYKRRKLHREIEAMCDAVAQRLEPLCRHEWAGLSESDRQAAIDAVVDTFNMADLSDETLFAVDADPVKLARLLRTRLPATPARSHLGEPGRALYDRLLDECSKMYVQLIVHLASFTPRGVAELLTRLSSLSEQVERLLERLPATTLDVPASTDQDLEFLERYLAHISGTLDEVELFGIDVRRYRPRTTLSVAYLSLAVSPHVSPAQGTRFKAWERGELRFGDRRARANTFRVEQALSLSPRTLLRGDPGSGKTTLLRWLAVTAARGAFAADLTSWNGRIPFLIKLRSYAGARLPGPERFLDGVASQIVGVMPEGWVHRQLDAGRALLLIDGVDELPSGERHGVRDWIRGLVKAYPQARVVVTARPTAATAQWMAAENFAAFMLERMGPVDVQELIAHWHAAIRDAGDLPCGEHELPAYETALLAQLDASPHLQALATNPMLCAMLCALNLDRRKALPPDRMGVYNAALELLLERRDIERRIPSYAGVRMDARGKLQLLQYLAWRLSLNNRAELSRSEAEQRLEERLATMPLANEDSETVLNHLLDRSGVIREPVVGRIDFVHRTFQEYLTAREAAEYGDVGFLVDRAHLDTWRETVVMAAGHANVPTRHELLSGLLDRADTEPKRARRLRLLAATCLETVGPLKPTLRARVEGCLAALVPPRRWDEARSLALAGAPLLRCAPRSLRALSPSAAHSTIQSIALVGGPDALNLLAAYAHEKSSQYRSVHQSLLEMCRYFDPHEYAKQVLAHLDLTGHEVWIEGRTQLEAFRRVPRKGTIGLLTLDFIDDLENDLADLPPVQRIQLHGHITDLSPLARLAAQPQRLLIWSEASVSDLTPLAQLSSLTELVLGEGCVIHDLSFLRALQKLRILWLHNLKGVEDFTPLADLPELEELRLVNFDRLYTLDVLRGLPKLSSLQLLGAPPPGGLGHLAAILPQLRDVRLFCRSLTDVESLGKLAKAIRWLEISSPTLTDLRPLQDLVGLEVLYLHCEMVTDLSPLARLPKLRDLILEGPRTYADLSSLAGCGIEVFIDDHEMHAYWRKRLGRSVKIS